MNTASFSKEIEENQRLRGENIHGIERREGWMVPLFPRRSQYKVCYLLIISCFDKADKEESCRKTLGYKEGKWFSLCPNYPQAFAMLLVEFYLIPCCETASQEFESAREITG